MKNNLIMIAFLSVCLVFTGCSFSTSSKTSSESSSSPSRSSGGDVEESAESVKKTSSSLQEDVETLTILYVGSAGSAQDFQRELAQTCSRHGIVDWENSAATFKAIGAGLKRAGVSKGSIDVFPFIYELRSLPLYPHISEGFN